MQCEKKRCTGDVQDNTIINQIMLKFRPIAPKPISDGSSVGKSLPEKLNKKRVKRKYVRVKKRKSSRLVKDSNNNNNRGEGLDDAVAAGEELPANGSEKQTQCWIDFSEMSIETEEAVGDLRRKDKEELDQTAQMIRPAAKVVVESWITMESVTDTCGNKVRLGCTDEEKMRNLETDTCPGFISNSLDQVEWINPAYRRMADPASGGGAPSSSEFVVRFLVREKFLLQWPSFSCSLRLVNYYCKKEAAAEMKKVQMTVPCDVWKMDFGGFAWRLDVEAALTLGR